MQLSISAYLSSEVVGEDRIRLEIYRRLSKFESAKGVPNYGDNITLVKEDETKEYIMSRSKDDDVLLSVFIYLCAL